MLGTVNQQLTPLIEQANASLSPSLQGPLMQQIDKTVIQQGLLVPLVFMPSIVAYNKNRVGRERRGADRPMPFEPRRHLHQEVARAWATRETDRRTIR